MVSPLVGFTAGGQTGSGPNALMTNDGAQTWTEQSIDTSALMIVTNVAADPKSAIIAGVSLGAGSIQYSVDGVSYTNSSERRVSVEAAQAAYVIGATAGNAYAVVGQWNLWNVTGLVNGVAVSDDGGASFNVINTGSSVSARYGSFVTPQTWFLAMGDWPASNNSASSVGLEGEVTVPFSRRINLRSRGLEYGVELNTPKASAADDNAGWNAQILRTDDSGATWNAVFANQTFVS